MHEIKKKLFHTSVTIIPLTQGPIFLLSAKEKEENRQFMIDFINQKTDQMQREGFSMTVCKIIIVVQILLARECSPGENWLKE